MRKGVELDGIGLGNAIEEFARNAGVFDEGEQIWEHKPVNIVEFIESSKFMDARYNPSTKIGCYPCVMDDMVAIFGTNAEDVAPIKRESFFSEAVGTGKSTKLSWMCGYTAYKLLCLRNPIKWYNEHGAKLLPNSKISIAMISRTEENSKEVVFQRLNMSILQSEWFNEFYLPDPQVMSKVVFDSIPRNRKQHKMGHLYKNISIVPGSSSEYSVLGLNCAFSIIDEATKFKSAQDRNLTTEHTDQAEILYSALKARTVSRFADNGHICCVGNPESDSDFLEQAFKRYDSDPLVYTVKRRAVWNAKMPDYNPDLLKADGTPTYPHFYFNIKKQRIVPEEVYQRRTKSGRSLAGEVLRVPYGPSNQYFDVFRDRPEIALRDYAGWPTQAIGAWWSDAMTILPQKVNKDRVSPMRENELTPEPTFHPDFPDIPDFSEVIDIVREDWALYGVHIDLSEVGDGAVLVMSHPTGLTHKKSPLIKLDLIYRYQPSQAKPFRIGIMRELVWWLWKVKKFPIGLITTDQWQSAELRQTFELAWGLQTDKLSVDAKGQEIFDNLKWTITEGRFDYFPYEQFNTEIYGLEKNGKKVEKNQYGNDDVAQGVAGSVWNSRQLALAEVFDMDESWELDNDLMAGEDYGSSAEVF